MECHYWWMDYGDSGRNKRNREDMIWQWLVSPLIILPMKADCRSQNSTGPLVWKRFRLEPLLMHKQGIKTNWWTRWQQFAQIENKSQTIRVSEDFIRKLWWSCTYLEEAEISRGQSAQSDDHVCWCGVRCAESEGRAGEALKTCKENGEFVKLLHSNQTEKR